MDIKYKNCSFKEHSEINAISYCFICRISMCNKCEIFHSKMFEKHKSINIDKYTKDYFTGFCKEENHPYELEYFCKSHRRLCCAKCVVKIGNKKDAIHKDCDVCTIEDIKDEKINKLNENIKNLEELSKTLQDQINKLKNVFEKVNNKKEEIKIEIQKTFTKIRNELNNREELLLIEVEEIFDKYYIKEETIKEGEKLPNKVKNSLTKCKNINFENIQLNSLINDCINIENDINTIDKIKRSIIKYNNMNELDIQFISEKKEDYNVLIEFIKKFGKILRNTEGLNDISQILNNDINKQTSIINWIKEKINKNIIQFQLLFRMSENGTKSEDFHKLCDNKGPTLTLIRTTKQRIFGGFTPLSWGKAGSGIKDPSNQTFIFSCDLNKKYDIIKLQEQAINRSNDGPKFGDCDIKIENNMKNGVSFANSNCNFLSNNNLELTGGHGDSEKFETDEIEIFKVIY